jgi:hypothetical protein
LFDKSPDRNWLVTWHQDRALPLEERREVPGWGPWSVKSGITYAQDQSLRKPMQISSRRIAGQYDETSTEHAALKRAAIALWYVSTTNYEAFKDYVTRLEGDLTPEQDALRVDLAQGRDDLLAEPIREVVATGDRRLNESIGWSCRWALRAC